MSDNDIKIYNNQNTQRNQGKSLGGTILNLKWLSKLKKVSKENTEKPIYIKKELEAEEMLQNAEIHCQANRPLKKIKEFTGTVKFCQCCYNPMKDQIHVTNFNYCDSTDEFAEFGTGISLYFFYLKYAIIILLFSFFVLALPSLLISKLCTEEIIGICDKIYARDGGNIAYTFPYCKGFENISKDSFFYNNQIILLLKLNAMNLKEYREIYLNVTNGKADMNKVLFNYHLIYFIGLLAMFIIHSIYTLLWFNINKQYDMSVTSPSDYAAIITNMQSAFEIFYYEVKKINKLIRNNYFIQQDDPHIQRKIYKQLQKIGLEKVDKENEINISEGFNNFIRNIICGNENGKPYDIHLINICYKMNKFKMIKEQIEEKNNNIFLAKNDPEQINKNKELDLPENKYRFFYYPLDVFGLYICPFTLYEKDLKISKIEKEKIKLENKLKKILNNKSNLTKDNFSGVVFIIFNSMKEKEKFIEYHQKNILMTFIYYLSSLKYYLCTCCINPAKKKDFLLKKNIKIEIAPEPEDVIYENLEFDWVQRLSRILLAYFISSIIIVICFFLILYLNNIQIRRSQSDHDDIVNRYGVSILISLIIALINSFFQKILNILTKIEKQICMTDFFLSYSIKLTVLTFCSSVLTPYLSNNLYQEHLNHDILITNCFTMFISNSFLIPITWIFNFEFILKKLRKCIIKKKNKRLPQKELNSIYELLDMDIASKYSYVLRTLFMCFFYLPIFPLGIPICFIGFIFSYFLEKYNFIKNYKKPIMLNSRIFEVYSKYFILNLFMVSLGDYLFLDDVFSSNLWLLVNIISFSILLICPYDSILSIDLIEINESDIKVGESYEDYFYNFFNDYERNNPFTKKEGIQHFLDKLLEKVLITKDDYDTILQNYEHMNLLEIYYKYKLNFGRNLLKRVLYKRNNMNSKKSLEIIDSTKNVLKQHSGSEEIKEESDNKSNGCDKNININNNEKINLSNKELILNFSNQNQNSNNRMIDVQINKKINYRRHREFNRYRYKKEVYYSDSES